MEHSHIVADVSPKTCSLSLSFLLQSDADGQSSLFTLRSGEYIKKISGKICLERYIATGLTVQTSHGRVHSFNGQIYIESLPLFEFEAKDGHQIVGIRIYNSPAETRTRHLGNIVNIIEHPIPSNEKVNSLLASISHPDCCPG